MRSVNRRTFAIGSIVAAPAIVAAVRTQAQESTPPAVASPEACDRRDRQRGNFFQIHPLHEK